MTVYSEIMKRLETSRVHMTLIDPASQKSKKAALMAEEAEKAGSDFIMIGGSTSVSMSMVDETVLAIKDRSSLKTILFPGSAEMVSPNADAIFFMTLMNSRNPKFLMGHQIAAARTIRKMGMETISMGYVVFEPGMTVGRIGEADLVSSSSPEKAISYALAAEMFGMKLVYFEAGSGAPNHVSCDTVKAVKKEISIPLIVGGGIRTREAAGMIAESGADIVVTGTVAEKASSVFGELKPIIAAIKGQ